MKQCMIKTNIPLFVGKLGLIHAVRQVHRKCQTIRLEQRARNVIVAELFGINENELKKKPNEDTLKL